MIDIASQSTVYTAFKTAAERWPDRPFLNVLGETAGIYGIEAGEWSYRRTFEAVERLKQAYLVAGYVPGGRVLLLMENRPDFFLHWFALNALGLSVVPINPDLQSSELNYIAGHAEPVLAVTIPPRIAQLEAASAASGVRFSVIGLDEHPPGFAAELENRIQTIESEPLRREAAMLYTSGTTGEPKGCILANLYFLAAGRWYAQAGGYCALREDGERMLTPLPIFHMNAMAYSAMAMIAVGGCLTALDRFHPRTWWQSVREARATCVHYLGVMPSLLMKAEPSDADRKHMVRFGFGAGIDAKLHGPFEERFGFPLVEAWAMTETGAGAVIAANQEPRKRGTNCLGRARAGVEVRIVTDNGMEAGPHDPGELLVRHEGADPRHGFFSRYHRDEQATAEAWEGGWFHTGDIVMRDGDGDIFFVDRKKNVIRRSGENIAAVEVESMLMQHPDIKAAGVAPVCDDIRGEEVFACLVLDGQKTQERARAIVAWCLEHFAYYKAPGYVAFIDSLPLTATQKIQRGQLKDMAALLRSDPGTADTRDMKKRQAA